MGGGHNTKNVEVLVGVMLPVAMLFAFEWLKKKDDKAAGEITRMLSEPSVPPSELADSRFVPFPATMVMTSVLVIGGWIFLLGLWQDESRTELMVFAFALLFLGGALRVWLVRQLRPPTPDVTD